MPKKDRSTRRSNKTVKDRDIDDVDAGDESYFDDEVDKYHSEREKILFEESDDEDYESNEEEVLGISDSDIEENVKSKDDEQYGMSAQAWGKKKSSFYGTDAIENLEGSDREEAEHEEEEEVLAIQRRLALQIDEDDFGFDMLPTSKDTKEDSTKVESAVEADFSSLPRKAQWKLLRKQSPELEGLIDDFKEKVNELETELCPLMRMIKKGNIPQGFGSDLISLKYRSYLAYIMNISFYLMLKSNKSNVQNHPVISRLVQYKTVINRVAPLCKNLRPEIEKILSDISENSEGAEVNKGTVFDNNGDLQQDVIEQNQRMALRKKKRPVDEVVTKTKKTLTANLPVREDIVNAEFSKSMNEKLLEEEDSVKKSANGTDDEEEGDERRAINYEIAKNKGLKQKRRKIERNPRVKMREKFRKAKIRRRGQVREYRPELKKYSGEASGIRIGVKKSVTLQ